MSAQLLVSDRKRQAQRTAVHEAGHAVVATAIGFTPTRMWIDAHDGGGYCEFSDLPHDDQITTFETLDRVMTCDLGGPVASCLWDGDEPRRAARQMLELERAVLQLRQRLKVHERRLR